MIKKKKMIHLTGRKTGNQYMILGTEDLKK